MRTGDTVTLKDPPSVAQFAAVVGKKESEGPLSGSFDESHTDNTFGEKTWEKAESALQERAVQKLLEKASLSKQAVELIFAGDLENQTTASAYTQRSLDIPYVGLYGACSTMAESLAMAAAFVSTGLAKNAVALTSSHFCAAERQFRFPLEYGGKRTPTSQWTVTGAGACLLLPEGEGPYVKRFTVGRVADLGVSDLNNMGAAMAPAAAKTLAHFFEDTHTAPCDFDRIYTGDLGAVGTRCLRELMRQEYGLELQNHEDCGLLIFDRKTQNVQAGASGCGCGASVLCGHILPALKRGELKRALFIATGALMSPTTVQQGESIPCVAHLVELSHEK